ncbi:MAG: hypothetical protein KKF48_03915 [Nanoarchaeota archaeon]|nr:hypothetical protein [Nanoarchaeota archaeon]MBU1028164.1 hypothetical protein [Nanoarchaeota archaeon]
MNQYIETELWKEENGKYFIFSIKMDNKPNDRFGRLVFLGEYVKNEGEVIKSYRRLAQDNLMKYMVLDTKGEPNKNLLNVLETIRFNHNKKTNDLMRKRFE